MLLNFWGFSNFSTECCKDPRYREGRGKSHTGGNASINKSSSFFRGMLAARAPNGPAGLSTYVSSAGDAPLEQVVRCFAPDARPVVCSGPNV